MIYFHAAPLGGERRSHDCMGRKRPGADQDRLRSSCARHAGQVLHGTRRLSYSHQRARPASNNPAHGASRRGKPAGWVFRGP